MGGSDAAAVHINTTLIAAQFTSSRFYIEDGINNPKGQKAKKKEASQGENPLGAVASDYDSGENGWKALSLVDNTRNLRYQLVPTTA